MSNALPDLRLLRIFAAVVRHQGFAAAQQELNLSTSAISTYMSQLENQLGIVLCHRGRGGFSLTSKGELFHQETLRILGELEGFERYALALKGELRGTLNLGVLDSTVSDPALPLAEVIGAFSREHPAVHLHLLVQSPYELQLSVLENRQDLAIGAFSSRMNGLVYQPLYREQHWLYCSDRHPLFDGRRIPADLITQQRMVGRGYWSQAELARHGLHFDLQTPWWNLAEAACLARDFPDTLIVLNHAGLPSDRSEEGLAAWQRAMARFAECPNVALKISGIGQAGRRWSVEDNAWIVRESIALFGVERAMFASNFPVDSLCGSFDDIYGGFKRIVADLPYADQERLFHSNARRIYRTVPDTVRLQQASPDPRTSP